jgi:hypothetical protein
MHKQTRPQAWSRAGREGEWSVASRTTPTGTRLSRAQALKTCFLHLEIRHRG